MALSRSESITSAIARPDGPHAMVDAADVFVALSIFYLLMSKWYVQATRIAWMVCYLHQVK